MLVVFFFVVSNIFFGRTPELQGDILRADENGLNLLAVWELGYIPFYHLNGLVIPRWSLSIVGIFCCINRLSSKPA
jgi:hypothetical protein